MERMQDRYTMPEKLLETRSEGDLMYDHEGNDDCKRTLRGIDGQGIFAMSRSSFADSRRLLGGMWLDTISQLENKSSFD